MAFCASESTNAESSLATADGIKTSSNWARRNSNLPINAKLDSGDVSLTTSIGKISLQFRFRVVASDASLADF